LGLAVAVLVGKVVCNKGKNNLRQGRLLAAIFVASLWASAAWADGMYDMRGTTIPNFGTDPTQLPGADEAPSLPAQPVAPTQVENVAPKRNLLLPLPDTTTPAAMTMTNHQQVAILPDEQSYFEMRGDATRYAPLESVRLALDMQNVTLKQAVDQIVQGAASKVGPWSVRWQLAEENRYLLDELMNITAETTFDEFLAYMTEKVVNMSGVKLSTKVFNIGRVIVISDS
jgi:hypothetical protein